jgi:hypothetical protein
MQEEFRFPGIVPFCIETQKTRQEINDRAASELGYPTQYVGSLYPLGMNLKMFTDLYWRMKKVNFNYSNTYSSPAPGGGFYSSTIVLLSNAYDIKWVDNQEPASSLENLKKRVCPDQYKFVGKSTFNSSLPGNGPFEYTPSFYFTTNPLIGGYSGDSYIGQNNVIFGGKDFSWLPRVITEFSGGDPNNLNNYIYYPLLHFGLIGGYNGFGWATFGSSKWFGFSSVITRSLQVTVNNENIGEIIWYQRGASFGFGTTNTSSINIELYPKPTDLIINPPLY